MDNDPDGDDLIASIDLAEVLQLNKENVPMAEAAPPTEKMEFPFPFEPYDIQLDFMTALYSALKEGKMGIFESPTGTGKSMSLICGALRWLQDSQKEEQTHLAALRAQEESSTGDAGADWVASFERRRRFEREVKPQLQELETKSDMREKVRELKTRRGVGVNQHLELSYSRLFGKQASKEKSEGAEETEERMDDEGGFGEEEDAEAALEANGEQSNMSKPQQLQVTKIFYCSRTHSQLAQFLREFRRSPYAGEVATLCLGARQSLCVNEAVRRLGSNYLINERCLELKAKAKPSNAGCPFRRSLAMTRLSDELLTEVLDIEDMAKQGRNFKACPYYSARNAVPWAQLVLLPYQMLLHKDARNSALGFDALKGSVVIVDEAHNLLDTIANVHSALLTFPRLSAAQCQLAHYMTKHRTRFHANNWLRLSQLAYLLKRWLLWLRNACKKASSLNEKCTGTSVKPSETVAGGSKPTSHSIRPIESGCVRLLDVNAFLSETQTDSVNLFPLLAFLRSTGLVRKLSGYPTTEAPKPSTPKQAQKRSLQSLLESFTPASPQPQSHHDESQTPPASPSVPASSYLSSMTDVEAFMEAVSSANSEDGRIILTQDRSPTSCSMRFLPLNPANHFHDVVREARSVVLAGGTMQPMSEFSQQLFRAAGCPDERIVLFSCGHVVSADRLLLVSVNRGAAGEVFNFSFSQRRRTELIVDCGQSVKEVAKIVPDGMVIFFPSYDYLDEVYETWDRRGVLRQLSAVKRIFREPRHSTSLEQVLAAFSASVTSGRGGGAVLLCVVGGKMSEGINFSDELGRAVVIVGLPYANPKDPQLMEKMAFMDRRFGAGSGQTYYQGLCMKAVNQSIGRAIRHRKDFATVFLFDERYQHLSVSRQLPAWMQPSLFEARTFSDCCDKVRSFLERLRD